MYGRYGYYHVVEGKTGGEFVATAFKTVLPPWQPWQTGSASANAPAPLNPQTEVCTAIPYWENLDYKRWRTALCHRRQRNV